LQKKINTKFNFRICIPLQYCDHIYASLQTPCYGKLQKCWPLVPKFAGSNPAEAVGFLQRKDPQHAFLQRGNKAVGPMS